MADKKDKMTNKMHKNKKIYVYIVTKMQKYYCVFGEYVIQSLYEIDYILSLIHISTAVGTAINVNPVYLFHIIRNINLVCGTDCVQADDLFDATQNLDCFVHTSSVLRICAVNLSKRCV